MKIKNVSYWCKCVALMLNVGVVLNCSAESVVVDVKSGEDINIVDAVNVNELISSGHDLVKTGDGRLIIDSSLKGYKGEIRIEKGYLLATHNESFGDVDKGTVVSNGATLEFKNDTNELLFGKEQITVSGIGVNGCGALCHTGTVKDQWRAVFQRIALTGNARFGGVPKSDGSYRRWDIRGGQGTFDMQGYNLEVVCCFGIAGANVENPGNINVTGKRSQLCFEGGYVRMNGSAENTLTIEEGATLSSQSFKTALKWAVVIDGGTIIEQNCTGDYENTARIDGPVTITEKGMKIQTFNAGGHWSFGGKVTANGTISLGGSVNVNFVLLCDGDDVAGRVQEYLYLRSKADENNLNSSLRIRLHIVPEQEDVLKEYARDFSNERFDLDLTDTSRLVLKGSQEWTKYRQLGGYVKVDDVEKVHKFKDLTITGDSTLDFVNTGAIDIHTNALNVGGVYPSVARMRIADTSFVTNWKDRVKGGVLLNINVGPVRNVKSDGYLISDYFKGRGILEICEGAVVSNVFNLGYVATDNDRAKNCMCHGSLFIRGGDVCMVGSSIKNDYVYNRIGSTGSGYVDISGGKVVLDGTIYPAAGRAGRGLWYQRSGEVYIKSGNLIFGQYSRSENPSKGVIYQTGGKFESSGGLVFGKTLYDTANSGNQDQFTIAGGEITINHGIDLAGATNAKTIVNLNGGTLKAMFMQTLTNENQTIIGTGANTTLADTYAWINLNGGTYSYKHRTDKLTDREAYKAKSFFYGDPERMRLTSFAGGAVLDTAGHDRNLNHTITAPTGNGLVSLALPENIAIPDWMFVGAPYIEITGDGSGASAVAEFDSVDGRITGFTITSPGNDYTEISATLTRGGYTNSIPLVCSLGKVASGGLTKKGEGTLLMNAANTYGGKTRVEGGVLKVVHADAIPENNGIEISGGTLDAGGFEKEYGAINATSGTLQNAAGSFASFVKTGSGTFMFDAPLSSTAVLEVKEGTLKLPVKVPGLLCGEKIYMSNESMTEFNNGIGLTNLGIDLQPSIAYTLSSAGYFSPHHYVSYSGYVWNRSATNETWTFAYAFDDHLYIYVNGTKLQSEKKSDGTWGTLYLASATLTPGANAFLIQLYNATGDGGAINPSWVHGGVNWTQGHVGITFNPNGGDSTNGLDYVHMVDPGDGSLFTVLPYDNSTIPSYGSLQMWPGTALDVCGGIYAFDKELKVTESVFGNPVQVLGGVAFAAGARVDIADLDTLDRNQGPFTILQTSHGISGVLPKLEGAWRLRVTVDGKNLELVPRKGAAIVLR